jgi:hypothetical protein
VAHEVLGPPPGLVEEVGQGRFDDDVDLAGVDDVRGRSRDAGDHGHDEVGPIAGRDRGQAADDLHGSRVDPRLLPGFAGSGLDDVLPRFDAAPGEDDVAGMGSHVIRSLGEDHPDGPGGIRVQRNEDRRTSVGRFGDPGKRRQSLEHVVHPASISR